MQSLSYIDFENFGELIDSEALFDISIRAAEFQRHSNSDMDLPQDFKVSLLLARKVFDSALMILRQELDFENNEYIRENKRNWDWMIDNLNRFDKRLDEKEKEIMDIITKEERLSDNSKARDIEYVNYKAVDASSLRKLNSYKRELDEGFEHLIYFPIKNSIKKFINIPKEFKDGAGMPLVKDKKLFNYFLFIYMFNASQMLGGVAREESPKTVRNTVSSSMVTSGTGTEYPLTPSLPENIKIDEKARAFKESIANFFSAPSELEEENAIG